jgi:hemoglobin
MPEDIPSIPTTDDLRRVFTPAAIETLVHSFYGQVRSDPMLGPVFDKRIKDWTPHLERMIKFWRSVLRADALYKPQLRGTPPELHEQIEELRRDHFDRWLWLWGETARSVLPPRAADHVVLRAQRIGVSLAAHLPPRPVALEAAPPKA